MGSFKANGREQGSRERRNIKHARRRGLLNLEWLLEERVLLSVVWHPKSTNLADVENGPMANLGSQLINLYEAFQGGQTNSSALAKQFPLDQFQGDSVLMGLTAYTDFQGFETSLSNLGMQIVDTNPTDGLVDGWTADQRAARRRSASPDLERSAGHEGGNLPGSNQRGRLLDVRQRRQPAHRPHRRRCNRGRHK